MTEPEMTYSNALYCGEHVVCPYCGEEWDELPSFDGFNFNGVEECDECGHSFEIGISFTPDVTTYQYNGRTKNAEPVLIDEKNPRKCDLCGNHLVVPEDILNKDDYYELYSKCPICGKVVCNDCERNLKPCCNEYELWIGKSDE